MSIFTSKKDRFNSIICSEYLRYRLEKKAEFVRDLIQKKSTNNTEILCTFVEV